jgi:hypothetical protein
MRGNLCRAETDPWQKISPAKLTAFPRLADRAAPRIAVRLKTLSFSHGGDVLPGLRPAACVADDGDPVAGGRHHRARAHQHTQFRHGFAKMATAKIHADINFVNLYPRAKIRADINFVNLYPHAKIHARTHARNPPWARNDARNRYPRISAYPRARPCTRKF